MNKKNVLTRIEVVSAAEACFKRYGVRRTSMADVAEELGVARQTIYRVFDSRTELLEFIASNRIAAIGRSLKPQFDKFKSLQEALVDGSIASIRAGLSDDLLPELFEGSGDNDFARFWFRGSPKIKKIMMDLWGPLIRSAHESGILKTEISEEDAVEWIQNVHALATIRSDYDIKKQKRVFQKFLVPSLINS